MKEKIINKLYVLEVLLRHIKEKGGQIDMIKYGDNNTITININKLTFSTKVVSVDISKLSSINEAYKKLARYYFKYLDECDKQKAIKNLMAL